MDTSRLLQSLTIEEKAMLLSGAASMETAQIERLQIKAKRFADGPHGIRASKEENGALMPNREENCTLFPNLCCVGATWDKALTYEMGQGLAEDCVAHQVDLLLGPGLNIKRTPLCGRNFEYLSEDPILTGELGAAYISGLQSSGVAACPKHFAVNSQERHRMQTSVELDLRVLHEIYLKGFEIAVKKAKPKSLMCAYNKVHSIWCGENGYLMNKTLKDSWGFDGFVMSDWGAVRNICRSLMAGLDLQMPGNPNIVSQIKTGLDTGQLTQEALDKSAGAVLSFLLQPKAQAKRPYDRDRQHDLAVRVAAAGIVLLKNDRKVLPLTAEKYKKIAVLGEYAANPLIMGQGSAEVYPAEQYIQSPLEALKERLGEDTQITYYELYKRSEFPKKFIWDDIWRWRQIAQENDAVVVFLGSMESEDTEQFDRQTITLNPNMEYILEAVSRSNPNVIAVLQSGSALALGDWKKNTPAIVQMWLAGEGAGSAIADVLTGLKNPCGKLPETFPKKLRTDLQYPGDGLKVCYNEGLAVGYRYYDSHPDEVEYPFGHGLSYTTFAYSDFTAQVAEDALQVSLTVENIGGCDGAEVVQFYVSKDESCVSRPPKELKAFEKVFLAAGEQKTLSVRIPLSDLAYYNVLLEQWVVEPGCYSIMAAASSRDIRCRQPVILNNEPPYTINSFATATVG